MGTRLFTRSLQYMMMFAALGAALGAFLMFWLGASKLFHAVSSGAVADPLATTTMTTSVMGATDAFLFGVVLITFSYAIMFGFVIDQPAKAGPSTATWTGLRGVGELKHTLIEVILVYLVVDFATDLVEEATALSWQTLVVPLAIVLIAGALRLLGSGAGYRPADLPDGTTETTT
jgi:uncharacterized membrane protein YqhA